MLYFDSCLTLWMNWVWLSWIWDVPCPRSLQPQDPRSTREVSDHFVKPSATPADKMAYGWCYCIWGLQSNQMLLSCCKLKVHRAIFPGLQHLEHIGFGVRVWLTTKGNLRMCPSVWLHFFPVVCPLTCYVTGQLKDFYFLFPGCASGKSQNRKGFIIWCYLL